MERDPPFRAKRTVAFVFAAWLLMVVVAPWTLSPGTVTDLSGHPSSIDNWSQIEDMNPFAAAIYLLGDFNCHQKVERSFFLNDNQMPFCARDVGIFIGLAVGMAAMLLVSPRFYLLALAALILPILVDGGLQYIGAYESTNPMRLITGILGGVGVAYFLNFFAQRTLGAGSSIEMEREG
jgi:uncharacterized membrane protein